MYYALRQNIYIILIIASEGESDHIMSPQQRRLLACFLKLRTGPEDYTR